MTRQKRFITLYALDAGPGGSAVGRVVNKVGSVAAREDGAWASRLSAEVLWQLDRIGEPVISPQGRHVVVPATSFDVESDESEPRLWLLGNADEPEPRDLPPVQDEAATGTQPESPPNAP